MTKTPEQTDDKNDSIYGEMKIVTDELHIKLLKGEYAAGYKAGLEASAR